MGAEVPGSDASMFSDLQDENIAADDATLPLAAEHVAQPLEAAPLPPADPAEEDAYITEVCTRVNALGMDIWKSNNFPQEHMPDYY